MTLQAFPRAPVTPRGSELENLTKNLSPGEELRLGNALSVKGAPLADTRHLSYPHCKSAMKVFKSLL